MDPAQVLPEYDDFIFSNYIIKEIIDSSYDK
jgi:hypothetical protein